MQRHRIHPVLLGLVASFIGAIAVSLAAASPSIAAHCTPNAIFPSGSSNVSGRGYLSCSGASHQVNYTVSLQRYTGSWVTVRSNSRWIVIGSGDSHTFSSDWETCFAGNWYRSKFISTTTSTGDAIVMC